MTRKYKFDIWDIIIWISLLTLLIYIVAKITGIINTPDWVNLIPIITLGFFAGAFYQKVLGFMEKMFIRTDYLKEKTEVLNKEITNINSKLSNYESLKKSNENKKR